MQRSAIILALALFVDCAMACNVPERDVFGDYEHTSGPSPLSHLHLFWEDGSYIFNADTTADVSIVGQWSYFECTLSLYDMIDGDKPTDRLKIVGLEDRVLVIRFANEGADARFNKKSPMEPRTIILGVVAVFGALLILIWRPKTLAKALIAILCIGVLGLTLGSVFGDEELEFLFGWGSIVIAGYGFIAVVAAKVITAIFKR